jgi:hypothetical protein
MKYIILENRLNKLLDNLFIDRYGQELTKIVGEDGYTYFFDDEEKRPFELNLAGTLWVNDFPFLNQIKRLFSLKNSNETDKFFKEYFEEKYGVDVKRVNSEGGYSKPGDYEGDIDPWLQEPETDDDYIQVNESLVNNKIFFFLDSYLEDYSHEETKTLILFGKGKENQIAYDKGDQILFVTDHLFELIKNMFNLSKTGTKQVFKDYFQNKGWRVKRFM